MTEFVYTIKSHPTSYKGVNFRSRLEATWAAFFDLCGWYWEYEPVDLPGWTPDFILDKRVAVEVKPIRENLSDVSRFVNSGWSEGMLLLGLCPYDPKNSVIGWSMGDVSWGFGASSDNSLGEGYNGDLSLRSEDGLATIHYATDGSHGGFYESVTIWDNAHNITQWKRA